MAELVPVPLPLLLRRAFLEYRQEGKIFDLPGSKFFRGIGGLDFSVSFHGHRASTPLGPAAGPHGQLAQNIVLCWLGGARIIELKTIQALDELTIPRPCIDIANVGYNVEWSQELKLEQSLREYVGASMFLEILQASRLLGEDFPYGDTVFDMSAGYNLEGIRSPRVRAWIAAMKNAGPVIDELRASIERPFARYRDLPFRTSVSNTISLSTFHGCPAGEIEGIVKFLLTEMGVDVCVKLNPTLLGYGEVEYLLHDVLGYREIQLHKEAFENDLEFSEAVDLIPALQRLAAAHGRSLSVKFSNTLVVKNHKQVLAGDVMYLSGPPLHVLALNLIHKFRERVQVPMSFSGGLDAHNVADTLALDLIPVTTCTDLPRPGGYARLVRYLENLGARMTAIGVSNIRDFMAHHAGQEAAIVAAATANPRYRWERNKGTPRKIGTKLWLYDCINCDKCVPVCPNDANFVYETPAETIEYDNFELNGVGIRRIPGGVLRIVKSHQLANYADACNECGNCDIFCPEDGGPQHAKPRFFGSLESYRKHAGDNGFYCSGGKIWGTFDGESYVLALHPAADRAHFETPAAEMEIRLSDYQPVAWRLNGRDTAAGALAGVRALSTEMGASFRQRDQGVGVPSGPGPGGPPHNKSTVRVDMLPFHKLAVLMKAIADPRHVHFANAAGLGEEPIGN
jgi:putative selenate reductase